ncbi:MAG: family 1 glycosylhydrolase [Chthoniobacterales bacterium]
MFEKNTFAWGVSTSSYQCEDPAVTPGSPDYFETDWDVALIKHGKAPPKGNALYGWSHPEKALKALTTIGVSHYRFSVEWARVEPRPGVYNEAVIARYALAAKALKAAGIEPIVCLWHFTFPSWLYDEKRPNLSNWLHPDARKRWQAFVKKIVTALAPHVQAYAPQNEPNGQLATAYLAAMWPPAKHLEFHTYKKALAECIAHFRDAAKIVKSIRKDALIVGVHALPWWKDGELDVAHVLYRELEKTDYAHMDGVADVCDLLGINYYYSQVVSPLSYFTIGTHRGPNYSVMGWRIDPDGLYQQIKFVANRYKRPMMITENGIATTHDTKRVRYMQDHLRVMKKAMDEGYDVRGYFVWSLADNYEWHYGYKACFGLSKLNPKTFERELRPSALLYRDIIKKGISALSSKKS